MMKKLRTGKVNDPVDRRLWNPNQLDFNSSPLSSLPQRWEGMNTRQEVNLSSPARVSGVLPKTQHKEGPNDLLLLLNI